MKHLQNRLQASNQKVKYLTFESISDLNLFQENIEDFKSLYREYNAIFIDEFHYARQGGKKLKYLYDTTDIKFFISGSSSLELTFNTDKYMVGRILKFHLWPFSFREFLSFQDADLYQALRANVRDIFSPDFQIGNCFGTQVNSRLKTVFENYLIYGGYPAVVLAEDKSQKEKLLQGLFETYIVKDIRSLLQLASEDKLVRLVKFLAIQIGSLVEYKELSNVSKLKYKQLLQNIEILRQTYIVDLLKPFYRNKRTEITKNPKVYFLDTGLRNRICGDFRNFELRDDAGSLVENFAFISLVQREEFLRNINFWRTKSKAEVDFVIQFQGSVIPVEIKYSKAPKIGKSLHSFIKKFKPERTIVLTQSLVKEEKVGNCRVQFIPVYYL